MTGIPTPEAVEVMETDPVEQFRAWAGYMWVTGSALHTRAGVKVDGDLLTAVLDRLDAAETRALPLPRRYAGGPLEDGLYLWRPALWGAGLRDWASIDTSTLTGRDDFKEIVDAEAEVWLIGPITIPPIPESEEASS